MNIPDNFDRWMFDYQEGNLSGSEMEAFENFLVQNPEFEVEADAWSQAFVPNEEFVYPNAQALQKDRRAVAGWYGWATAAVAVLLVGSVYFFIPNETLENSFRQVADSGNATRFNSNNSSNSTAVNVENVNSQDLTENQLSSLNNGLVAITNINHFTNSNVNGTNGSNTANGVNETNGNVVNFVANNGAPINTSSNDVDLAVVTASRENVNIDALNQEFTKYEDDNNSKYLGNPTVTDLGFDVSANGKYDYSSWQNKVKRVYHKIEKMFDYPVGLTNLRDPELLLPNSNTVAFNPGFTGGMLAPRFQVNYRNQWFGTEQNSQQMTLSYDNYSYQLRGGVGVAVNAKDYGFGKLGDYSLNLNYSPKIILAKNVVFEPAVKMTLGVLNVNGNDLNPGSTVELERGRVFQTPGVGEVPGNQQLFYKDFGLGFVVNTKWFYAGFSADNINNHFESVYNADGSITPTSSPTLISGIVGFDYEAKRRPKDKPMSISPFVAYQQFGQRKELWVGANYRINAFTIGGSISQKKEFTAAVGMKFEKFKLVYHYDQTMSTALNKQIGSHNISIRFNGRTNKSRIK